MEPMNSLDLLIYTPGSSGTGHIFRQHHLSKELADHGVAVLAAFGADVLPSGLISVPYPRLILPRYAFNRRTGELADARTLPLVTICLSGVIDTLAPRIFAFSHHWGVSGELSHVLEKVRQRKNMITILAWRDIPDSPAAFETWVREKRLYEIIRKYVDHIVVFGDAATFDLTTAYRLPVDIASKLFYAGYVSPCSRRAAPTSRSKSEVLIAFGGGEGRADLLHDPLPCLLATLEARGLSATLVLGHYWTQAELSTLKQSCGAKHSIVNYLPQQEYIKKLSTCAVAIVAGGYNSTVESLATGTPTIVVTSNPSLGALGEVDTRAAALSARGFIHTIAPGADSIAVSAALDEAIDGQPIMFEAHGAQVFREFVQSLLILI